MPRYLISFNYGDMQVADAELPAVGEAARAAVRAASDAGVLVFAGGLADPRETGVVDRDGTVSDQPRAGRAEFIAGLTIVETPGRPEALAWARRLAAACRCAQEVREIMPDSELRKPA